ncbi:MAG: helicase-related protein, partial [Bacteroidota bacterium]
MAGDRPIRPAYSSDDRGKDKWKVLRSCRVVIAMAQTIEARKTLPFSPSLIMWDEGHLTLFREDTEKVIKENASNAQQVALTATPWRMDGQRFGGKWKLHQVCTTRELIEAGYLTPYKVFCLESLPTGKIRQQISEDKKIKDYSVTQCELIVDIATPQKVWEEWQKYKHLHTIGFVPSRKVGKIYADYFESQGQECAVITDKTSRKQRAEYYKKFREQKIVLWSIDVLAIGFDQPCATVAILLRKTDSLALFIQIFGRILRKFAGKEWAYFLDFTGTAVDMPAPGDIEDWENIPENNGKECGNCGYVNSNTAEKCKECGADLPKQAREVSEIVTEENVIDMPLEDVFAVLAKKMDERKMIQVKALGKNPKDNYQALKQRAFLKNNAPGKAYFDYYQKYNEKPDPAWLRGAVFGDDPTFEDACLFYGYLTAHKRTKNKTEGWLVTEMYREFGKQRVDQWMPKIKGVFAGCDDVKSSARVA